MRQSQTYRRGQHNDVSVDPNKYITYRIGVAHRLAKKHRLKKTDAWQLAVIPAFFMWLFRKPISYFKRRKIDKMLDKKGIKRSNKSTNETKE